ALQSIAGSHHRPRSYSGDRHGILSLPSNGRKAEERSQSELTKTELWKCRAMESLENQRQVSHPFHRPWKSLRDSHIPTASTTVPIYKTNTGRGPNRLAKGINHLGWAKLKCRNGPRVGSSALFMHGCGDKAAQTITFWNVLGWESDGNSPEPFASRTS